MPWRAYLDVGKTDPIERGLRPRRRHTSRRGSVGKTDPIERGLRPEYTPEDITILGWKNRPDRKGIKTATAALWPRTRYVGKTDPIERGLRRDVSCVMCTAIVGKTDPIERGLRLFSLAAFMAALCWKNRPDRKGIKTTYQP